MIDLAPDGLLFRAKSTGKRYLQSIFSLILPDSEKFSLQCKYTLHLSKYSYSPNLVLFNRNRKQISDSFQIEGNVVVVTVLIWIMNQMEFRSVDNQKENCHHDHIDILIQEYENCHHDHIDIFI